MPELLVHPQTAQLMAAFAAQPTHALLLVGPDGIGKGALAAQLASELLKTTPEKLANHPYIKRLEQEKHSISIDAIRELGHFLQLKTIGTEPVRRIIIIEHADGLTTEAQNAYLKLLEEPPQDTVMILTVSNQRALLPTIQSRLQMLTVHRPEEQVVRTAFAEAGKDPAAITQAYFLSGGLPGLMNALLDDDQTHPLTESVTLAKQLLQQSSFERLTQVEGLSKQKEAAISLFEALEHIAQVALEQAATKHEPARIKQWHRILRTASEAQHALALSANPKLVLTHAMLEL